MSSPIEADALVLFGATGDLARKKVFPALYQLSLTGDLDVPVVGVAGSAWGDDGLRKHARAAVEAVTGTIDEAAYARLASKLTLVSGDYRDDRTFAKLAVRLGEKTSSTWPSHPRCSSRWSAAWPESG